MNHSIAGSERNSVLSFHSEPGWVVERTHCVVEAFPGAAFTQIDTVVVVVAFVCLLSRFARLPHNPTLYRFSSCELPRRSTSRRPLEPDSRSRCKNERPTVFIFACVHTRAGCSAVMQIQYGIKKC